MDMAEVKKILIGLLLIYLLIPRVSATFYSGVIYADGDYYNFGFVSPENIVDGNTLTYGTATLNDYLYDNFTINHVGEKYNFTYVINVTDNGGGVDPTLKYWKYNASSWETSCSGCTSDTEYDIDWNVAVGETGKLKLYVDEDDNNIPGPYYNEFYISHYWVDEFDPDDENTVIYVYEEDNPTQRLSNLNILFTNSTENENYANVNIFTGDNSDIPIGNDVSIRIQSSGYGTRTFTRDLNSSAYNEEILYLVPTDVGSSTNFVVTSIVGSPIIGSTVQAIRTINGTEVVVEEKTTDSSGNANMYLDTTSSYTISLTASGYTSINYTITPTNPPYTLTMTTTDYEQMDWVFGSIYESFSPEFLVSGNNTLRYSLFDWNNTIDYWEFNVSYNGTVIDSKYNDTLAGGGIMNTTVDLTGYTGNISLTGRFKSSLFAEHLSTRVYMIYDYQNTTYSTESNYTLNETLTIIKENPELKENPTVKIGVGLLVIMLSIGAGGVVRKVDQSNDAPSTVVMLVVLSILSIIMGAVFTWEFFILTLLSVVMLMIMKSNM